MSDMLSPMEKALHQVRAEPGTREMVRGTPLESVMYPHAYRLKQLVAEYVEEPVEIVEVNPVFVTSVSMVPLGLLGRLLVFRASDGGLKAVPVPFGFDMEGRT
jgi:hypothetical protein